MRLVIFQVITSIVVSRSIKEFEYDKDFKDVEFDLCGAPPCVEYRWNSEIDSELWLQRIEMTGMSTFNLSDGGHGAFIKPMDVSLWKLKPASDFDAKLTLKDLESGEHIFISTTASRGKNSRHFESSTTISRDGTKGSYTFQVLPQYEESGLVIMISISETHDATTYDAADDVADVCQLCRSKIKKCRESSLCQGLSTCLERVVGLEASLQNLGHLRPGSYFNITPATTKCQYDAQTYADFLKAMDCVSCGSSSRLQTQILPGKMELVFNFAPEDTFHSRFKLKMGAKVCEKELGTIKWNSAAAISADFNETIQACLNVGAVSSFYKVDGDSTTVTVHISDYIGPMPVLESSSEIQPFSFSVISPQLLMKN